MEYLQTSSITDLVNLSETLKRRLSDVRASKNDAGRRHREHLATRVAFFRGELERAEDVLRLWDADIDSDGVDLVAEIDEINSEFIRRLHAITNNITG